MGSKALSEIQEKILDYIYHHYYEDVVTRGFYPSIRDIAKAVGLVRRIDNKPNPGHADHHLSELEDKGYIQRAIKTHNAIRLTDTGKNHVEQMRVNAGIEADNEFKPSENRRGFLPYWDTVPASSPRGRFNQQQPQEPFDILEGLESSDVYVLRVVGDSMIDAHICDGDYVIIKDAKDYTDGDIVVALRDDQGLNDVTLKRFYNEIEEKRQIRLQPSNKKIEPILVSEQKWKERWSLKGKVIRVIRKNIIRKDN